MRLVNQRKAALLSCAGALLALPACSTVTSRYVGDASTASRTEGRADGTQAGILYFLPRQLAKVTVKRTERKLDGAIKAAEQKVGGVRDAEAAIAAATAAISKTENEIVAGLGGDDGLLILKARLAEQKAALETAKKDKTTAEAALAAAKANVRELLAVGRAERRYAEASENLDNASQALDDAQNKQRGIETEIAALKRQLDALPARAPNTPIDPNNPDDLRRLNLEAALADKQNNNLKDAVADTLKKAKALTDAQYTMQQIAANTPDPFTAYSVAVSIELQPPSADPAQPFRLDPRHTIFRDDDHKLKVGRNGLLASANIIAEDRTADILVEIATFAGAMLGAPPGAGDGGPRGVADQCPMKSDDYSAIVDFADQASVDDLNKFMRCYGVRTKVTTPVWAADTRPTGAPTSKAIDGIVYRTPIEVLVKIERCPEAGRDCGDDEWSPSETLALALPQAGPISFVRQHAGLMTKTTYDTTFSDGILVDYASNRPSEALHLAAAPMRVLNGLFDGASKIISLRTGRNNALAGLSNSQLALLNAQANYDLAGIDNDRKLTEAERTLYEARVALQAAAINGDRTLTESQIALIQKQVALQTAAIDGQRNLTDAEIALLERQSALQLAPLSGASNLANARLGLIQAQGNLATGANTAQAQLSASELELAVALLRDRARARSISDCLAKNGPGAVDLCIP